jgi:hypothetical protein
MGTDEDDFGFRTPTRKQKKVSPEDQRPKKRDTGRRKRETSKSERPKKRDTGKHKRETGKHKRETGKSERPKKRDTGKSERPKKRDTGKHKRETGKHKRETAKHKAPASEPSPKKSKSKSGPLPMVAGIGAALILGGAIAALMSGGEIPPPEKKQADTFIITSEPTAALPVQSQPEPVVPRLPEPVTGDLVEVAPAELKPAEEKGSALEELAKKSATHAALARLLGEYAGLFDPKALHSPGPLLQSFRERQQREQELLERLRAMGPAAVDALKDMLLGLSNRQYRIFLGKGLAGIEGPDALAAVSAILGEVKDVALQTTLVRFLPANPNSARTIGEAISHEENGNLRCMLLREYHRRLAPGDEAGRDIFREAALNDADDNVRAEAVTIIGRRGDARDQGLMEQIITAEKNLSIRQRAIVSYAETGKEGSLPFLENLVRQPNTALPVRASAVLAIGRVGGDSAIQTLDVIAQTDQSQEIRVRAERLVQSLRRRQAQAQNPTDGGKRPIRTPMRIGTGQTGGRSGSPIRRQ